MTTTNYFNLMNTLGERCPRPNTVDKIPHFTSAVWSDDLPDLVSTSVREDFNEALALRNAGHIALLEKLSVYEAGEHREPLESMVKCVLLASITLEAAVINGELGYGSVDLQALAASNLTELGDLNRPMLLVGFNDGRDDDNNFGFRLVSERPQDLFREVTPSLLLGHSVNIEAVAAYCFDGTSNDVSIPSHERSVVYAYDGVKSVEVSAFPNELGVLAMARFSYGQDNSDIVNAYLHDLIY